MQAPQGDTDHHRGDGSAEGQHEIGDDEHDEAGDQQPDPANAVGKDAGRIGRERIDDAHHHHHHRHPGVGEPGGGGLEHEEGFREAGQHHGGAHRRHLPEGRAEGRRRAQVEARLLFALLAVWRILDAEGEEGHGNECRNAGHPHDAPEIDQEHRHQNDGDEGACEGAHRVQRLAQAEGGAAQFRRRDVGHQRVTRGTADALAHPVNEARGEDRLDGGGQRKQRLDDRRQPVTQQRQPLAAAPAVTQHTREQLGDLCRRLGNALEKAQQRSGGP